eukprot:CAMPEP_0113886556 /NCGR_PEP_ID=MMETSP0780_2-20120614/11628_1 /TAXON_ID=652834 /ORGANISM="Palpitomonas bilix" /LENGTH=57 /DNA_ID=CAMNT_0000874799 /DNA_START=73 /DNA_END=242 /DNA_ORIENTATION=+ /assembly_acc=CAM_ASM_000599
MARRVPFPGPTKQGVAFRPGEDVFGKGTASDAMLQKKLLSDLKRQAPPHSRDVLDVG